MPSWSKPYALLLVLTLVFFADLLLHPGQVLYSDYSDILAMHLPDKMFLVRSFHETGEMPLWCPYRFAGVPFIHDFQVGAYYPPHWLLLLLNVEQVGAGMSWLVVLHVLIAGWSMYGYSRFRGLAVPGAIVAAMGWMFSGKLLLHVLVGGHFNMLMLAWLPFSIWLFESALMHAAERKRWSAWLRASWAGAVFALLVLTAYPYVTLYAGLLMAAWTLGSALAEAGFFDGSGACTWRQLRRALYPWAALGTWAGLVAIAVGAAQLLPGLEAAKYATRSGALTNPFHETVWPLVFLAGPSVIREPANLMWEVRGGFGVLWLAVAVLAPVLQRGRTRFEAGVGVLFLLLALGGIVILYWVPGVGIFRLPSRIFLVAAFPVAFLAGTATHLLWCGEAADLGQLLRSRRVFRKAIVRLLFLCGLAFVLAWRGDNLRLHPYWATLAVSIPLMLWLLGPRFAHLPRLAVLVWCACLLLDLWALTWTEVRVRPLEEIYPVSPSVAYLAQHAQEDRVLDYDRDPEPAAQRAKALPLSIPAPAGHGSEPLCSPLGYGAPLALDQRIESLRGFNPIDVLRYKEYLQFVTDRDEPIKPLDDRCTFGFPVIGNFSLVNKNLTDLLGVRYLLLPGRPSATIPGGWQPVLTDAEPHALTIGDGGVVALGPYTLYRTDSALPRAFVVPEAAPLPPHSEVLDTLKRTDFHQTVLLEDVTERQGSASGSFRPALILDYQPNHIIIHVPDGAAGYLVLADIWYPGWSCTVDGRPQSCRRANYLFRAVELGAGSHHVEFHFEPLSCKCGQLISFISVVVLLGFSALGVGRRVFRSAC